MTNYFLCGYACCFLAAHLGYIYLVALVHMLDSSSFAAHLGYIYLVALVHMLDSSSSCFSFLVQ